jgi:diguanylate cyclase (GGDEF)-like protein
VRDLLPVAVEAVTIERNLVEEVRLLTGPIPDALRAKIIEADNRGVELLARLRGEGYEASDVVTMVLGQLPVPKPTAVGQNTAQQVPTVAQYNQAIRDLGGTPSPVTANAPLNSQQSAPKVIVVEAAAAPTDASGGGVSIAVLIAVVSSVALLGVIAVLLTRRRRNAALVDAATKDSLTGLFNRRRLDDDINGYAGSSEQHVAALMIDVDHFKTFNDDHGHAAGDHVLRRVGAVLSASVRADDVVYRYGGEEFCVLLPRATPAEAIRIAERIRAATSAMPAVGTTTVTVSVGGAIGRAHQVRHTLERADQALYRAKRDGRNRVTMG